MDECGGTSYFEFEILNTRNLSKTEYSPRFETSPNIFWQFAFKPKSVSNPEYCTLSLVAIRNINEGNKLDQVRHSAFPIKIIVKDADDDILKERERDIGSIQYGKVSLNKLLKRSTIPDKLKIGVRFNKVQFSQLIPQIPFPNKELPKDLITLWSNELLTPNGVDTRITVDDQYLYAKSLILKKRSEYFQAMLDGPWAENNSNDNDCFKYNIEITDFNYTSVFQMLQFLYTDKVQLTGNNNIWELYGIANKYLVTELEEQVKARILRGINLKTCAENLYRHAWKWPVLKDEFKKFVVQNFNIIRNTDEYKKIVENKEDYPMFHQLNTEILLAFVPEEPERNQNQNQGSSNLIIKF